MKPCRLETGANDVDVGLHILDE